VAPEVLAIFTGMTLKPRFCDSKQALKTTQKRKEKEGNRAEKKKDSSHL